MLYWDTGGVRGGEEVDPREREATRRRAGVVGGVGVGDRPAVGGGVGAGGGLTPGTVWGVGEQRRGSFRMVGGDGRGLPGGREASHAGDQRPATPQHRCSATTTAAAAGRDTATQQHTHPARGEAQHPLLRLTALLPLVLSRSLGGESRDTWPQEAMLGNTSAVRVTLSYIPLVCVSSTCTWPGVPRTNF